MGLPADHAKRCSPQDALVYRRDGSAADCNGFTTDASRYNGYAGGCFTFRPLAAAARHVPPSGVSRYGLEPPSFCKAAATPPAVSARQMVRRKAGR
eukprot:5921074-Prymnesium_polylepis.1